VQTALANAKLKPVKVSGVNAADLQLSLDYVYPSGMHTDSFTLSTELAMSLVDKWNRRPEAMGRVQIAALRLSSFSNQHATGYCQWKFGTWFPMK
jgi:hypothetical protein